MGSEYHLDVPGQHRHSLCSVPNARNVNCHWGTETLLRKQRQIGETGGL